MIDSWHTTYRYQLKLTMLCIEENKIDGDAARSLIVALKNNTIIFKKDRVISPNHMMKSFFILLTISFIQKEKKIQ
jgi:hypothetical protein